MAQVLRSPIIDLSPLLRNLCTVLPNNLTTVTRSKMRTSTLLSVMGAAGLAVADGRPNGTSICDYYTTALLTNNTAENQYTLVQLVVNTAVIGNYTKPNVGIAVPGILAKGMYKGTEVNLLPYFDGMLASTNGNGKGVSVNFLDGGAATPIMMNMPANSTSSAQYKLLTHLYQYFGYLLTCSEYGQGAFPAYQGHASMASVHQYMDLDAAEVGYFIEQVGMAAASFGVADADVTIVGNALNELFGYKCAPPTTVIPAQGAVLESICIADDCPTAVNATCSSYPAAMMPSAANSTNMAPTNMSSSSSPSSSGMSGSSSSGMSGSSSGMASSTSAMPAMQTTNGAGSLIAGGFTGLFGVMAAVFAL